MKCKNPNYVIIEKVDEEKRKVHFASSGAADYSESYRRYLLENAIEVPCGKCAACRLNYSREWANRCFLESLLHEKTWFITLSYRDDALKFGSKGLATLEKDALSQFVRKVRDYYGHDLKIRFFGCGEYGDETMRPHYHLILFGAPINDLTIDMPDMSKPKLESGQYPIFRRKNSNGDYVYFSQEIYNCWKKGKIEVEEASWNTSAYVSRYVMKKQKGRGAEIYSRLDILPPYLRMSTRPGIAYDWFIQHQEDLLSFDYLSVKNQKGVQTSRPPRYFEKIMLKYEGTIEELRMLNNKVVRMNNSKNRFIEYSSMKNVGVKADDQNDFIEKKSKLLIRDIT